MKEIKASAHVNDARFILSRFEEAEGCQIQVTDIDCSDHSTFCSQHMNGYSHVKEPTNCRKA